MAPCDLSTRLSWTITSVSLHEARLSETTPVGWPLHWDRKPPEHPQVLYPNVYPIVEAEGFLDSTQDCIVTLPEPCPVKLTCPGTSSQHRRFYDGLRWPHPGVSQFLPFHRGFSFWESRGFGTQEGRTRHPTYLIL